MGDYVGGTTPRMPKFKAIAPVGTSRHMGEISLSRSYGIFALWFLSSYLLLFLA